MSVLYSLAVFYVTDRQNDLEVCQVHLKSEQQALFLKKKKTKLKILFLTWVFYYRITKFGMSIFLFICQYSCLG